MGFSKYKAPQVLALPVGATFQMRSLIKLPGAPGDWARTGGGPITWAFSRRLPSGEIERMTYLPRYPVGQTCYLGVPHWRCQAEGWERGAISFVPMPRPTWKAMGGRYLPQSAATGWAVPIEIRVQRVAGITDADAVAELVEFRDCGRTDDCGDIRWWKNYLLGEYDKLSARDSFFSMLDAANGGKPVPRDAWCFAYTLRKISREETAAHA